MTDSGTDPRSEAAVIPGARDVRGTLDRPEGDAAACVVACPPHPQMGGARTDRRLRAVATALVERDVACLRFDYGPWDEGRGERADARNALRWADDRFGAVGLFGYSFGASVALRAVADGTAVGAVSVLAPGADAADAVGSLGCPLQVLYGARDDTVDWAPVVEAARSADAVVVELSADHHFVGQHGKVGERVATFLVGHLVGSGRV